MLHNKPLDFENFLISDDYYPQKYSAAYGSSVKTSKA
jgi:hypothetical protein